MNALEGVYENECTLYIGNVFGKNETFLIWGF